MKLLAPKTVILIGGENAISSKLEQEIKTTFNTETKRIAGQDRYQTATRIAEELGNREEIKLHIWFLEMGSRCSICSF